jgi:predicted Zn finger-like uncharacterized protein
MSLVTSCPACTTKFRIVPDQLKISEGWVRCGTCNEVFDASKRLEDPEADAARGRPHVPVLVETFNPQSAPATAPPQPELTTARPDTPEIDIDFSPLSTDAHLTPDSTDGQDGRKEPLGYVPALATSPHVGDPTEQADLPVTTVTPEPGPLETEISNGLPPPLTNLIDDAATSAPQAQTHNLQFVRQARRAAFWKKPWIRAVLALLLVLLSVVLVMQYVLHERDRLAARNPQARELLTGLCLQLGCEVKPLRDPEAIVIESSRFQKQLGADSGAEVYQLTFQLRNKADYAVAWPDLELSLTGSGDQPVVRVVLESDRYASRDLRDLASGREHNASVLIKLDPAAAGGRISGYRLLAFYR